VNLAVLAIPLAVTAVTLLVFLADLAVKDDNGRGIGALSTIGLLAVLGLTVFAPSGAFVVPGGAASDIAFVQDGFTLYMQRIVLIAGILGCLGSIDHVDKNFPRRQGEYFLMILFSLIGMTVLVGARELVTLIVAFELMSIPLYVLAAMAKKQSSTGIEGAWKLYLTGAVSSAITLYGLSFIVGGTGTTSIDMLATRLQTASPMVSLGMMLVLGGIGFKIGAVPFHMWVPDTYEGSPTPFVAFLSTAPKAAGFAVIARVFVEGFGHLRHTWWPTLLVVCVASMLIGNLFALPQRNAKRLLAYSGIAHIGLLVLAIGIGTPAGMGVVLFYLLAYVFANMGAFLVADVVGRQSGSDHIDAWGGLAQRAPALGLAMLIFLLSLGGIPFVAGFWAKLFLFIAAWQAGMAALVILGAVLAVVALFYYLRIGRSIYIEKPYANDPVTVGRPTGFAIAIALAGVLGMGLMPGPFIETAEAAGAPLAISSPTPTASAAPRPSAGRILDQKKSAAITQ
jgi:NADH-quinone oxidoreductase subunit N